MSISKIIKLISIVILLTGCRSNNPDISEINKDVLEKKKTFKMILKFLKAGDTINIENYLILPRNKVTFNFEKNLEKARRLLNKSSPTSLDNIIKGDSAFVSANNKWIYTYKSRIYKNDSLKGTIIMTFYGSVNNKIFGFYPVLNVHYTDFKADTAVLNIH